MYMHVHTYICVYAHVCTHALSCPLEPPVKRFASTALPGTVGLEADVAAHRGEEDPNPRSEPWTTLTPEVTRRMSWRGGARAVRGVGSWTPREGVTGRWKWSLSSHASKGPLGLQLE